MGENAWRRMTLLSLCLVAVCLPAEVHAHAALMANSLGQFTPREGTSTAEKTGPCGVIAGTTTPLPRSTNPTVVAPGATVEIAWVEMIKHPGYFIISFSPANDANFVPLAGAAMIPEDPTTPAPENYKTKVTLPTTPCSACTIQLIQVMQDTTPASNYYSCADIVIAQQGQPVPSPTPTVGPQPTPAPVTGPCH